MAYDGHFTSVCFSITLVLGQKVLKRKTSEPSPLASDQQNKGCHHGVSAKSTHLPDFLKKVVSKHNVAQQFTYYLKLSTCFTEWQSCAVGN